MALLGPQLIFTIAMTTFLQKVIVPHHSLALWLLTRGNLYFYSYPSDKELKKAAGIVQHKGKKKRNRLEALKIQLGLEDPFTVPKNINLELTFEPVRLTHMMVVEYLSEFRWLVDFSCMALVVYSVTEVYYAVVDVGTELNLSLIWLIMMSGFVLHTLFHLTALYFKTDDSGERSVCVTFSFFFLVIAMATLVVDEDILEFGLEDAHDEFMNGATAFLKERVPDSDGPMSLLTFKVLLTLIATAIGGILTFPGLRYAKMYIDAQRHYSGQRFVILCLHVSFLFPLFISLMWVKPVARAYFKSPSIGESYDGVSQPLMTDETFDLIRLSLIPVFCILRFCLTTVHLQSHLNMAKERFDNMKTEAGRISSVDLQKM
ncbi:putative transmembrane protein, partial [Apostichopus japonicus]